MPNYIGEIRFWAGPKASMPLGWMPLDFTVLPTAGNEILAGLFGMSPYLYLPDARSRTPIGGPVPYDPAVGTGLESIVLQVSQIASHNHVVGVPGTTNNSTIPAGHVFGDGAGGDTFYHAGPAVTSLAISTIAPTGIGDPHPNIPPYLGIVLMIRVTGGLVPVSGSAVGGAFTNLGGMLQFYCFSTILPAGLMPANGAEVLRATFTGLFSLIGTTFGVGDGSTTFNLPNTVGRALNGAGTGSYSGPYAGGSAHTYAVGDQTGVSTHVLTTSELPSHAHDFTATSDAGTQELAVASMIASGANFFQTTPGASAMDSGMIGMTGGGSAHSNWPPFLPITMLIAVDEPDDPGFDTGMIVVGPWAGGSPPSGMLLCDGSSVSTTTYAALFAIVGVNYGGSGGSFNLPDFRGRIPFHIAAANADAGLSQYTLGQAGGTEAVALTSNQLPAHSHPCYATVSAVSPTAVATSKLLGKTLHSGSAVNAYKGTGVPVVMGADTCRVAGGGTAHENRPPQLTMNFFIVT